MTLQPSLIIWTVICFGVLMLVLNFLLFKPLLSHMDARREKLERARAKAGELEAAREEKRAALDAEREAAKKEREKENRAEAERLKAAHAAEVKRLEAEGNAAAETLAEKYANGEGGLDEAIDGAMDDMVSAFAGMLVRPR